jgi:hypothetical protein
MQKLSFKIIITSFFYFLSIVSTTLFMNGCCNGGSPPLEFFRLKGIHYLTFQNIVLFLNIK